MISAVRIRRSTASDLAPIAALLDAANLPTAGAFDAFTTGFVADSDGRVVGAAALEVYADGALLRSVVVDPSLRGHGLGQSLASAAIEEAGRIGMPALYLLTTTAATFFPRLGFQVTTREAVPASVQQSIEFQSACPSTATTMVRRLP